MSQVPEGCPLTKRHMAILTLLSQGKENSEIAELLEISKCTLRIHLNALYKRANVPNRTAAVVLGLRRGWIDLPAEDDLEHWKEAHP